MVEWTEIKDTTLAYCYNYYRIRREKIHSPGIFRSDFRENGAAGNAKTCFEVVPCGVKIQIQIMKNILQKNEILASTINYV